MEITQIMAMNVNQRYVEGSYPAFLQGVVYAHIPRSQRPRVEESKVEPVYKSDNRGLEQHIGKGLNIKV